ncbi:lipase family protein [Rubripirellula amarantea]|nr:lipase family protein [Rubripirellula amarantea]
MILRIRDQHSREDARYLATACDLVYLDPDAAKVAFAEQLGLTGELVSVDNTQAFVGENDESFVIAFRGSQTPSTLDGVKDWLLTNARNFLVIPEGRIGTDFAAAGVGARFHRGFMQALDELWIPLYSRVDEAFGRKERPVWVTGHSLGGALALLCAWRMHQQFIPIHQVVTFGAPMIGNAAAAEAFAREFPDRIFRYVDAGDLVPKLPMMSLFSNDYGHVQREVVVGSSALVTAAGVIASVATKAAAGSSSSAASSVVGSGIVASAQGAMSGEVVDQIWAELSKGLPSHLMHNYLNRLTGE